MTWVGQGILADLYDAYQVDGAPGALKTLPSAAGVGVQTYRSRRGGDEASEGRANQ